MSRVFVVQQPARYDYAAGGFVPKYDLSPARSHGDLIFLLGPGNIFKDRMKKAREDLRAKLADFSPDDMILAVGDPVAIALTVMFASEHTGGRLNFLKWDRKAAAYELYTVNTH